MRARRTGIRAVLRTAVPATVPAAMLAVGAFAAVARADDVTIAVDDLLRPMPVERDVRFFPWPDPSGELTTHFEPAEPRVQLDEETLVKAVSFLAGGVELSSTYDGRIVCSAETAELVKAAVARLRAQRPSQIDLGVELTIADAAVLSARESIAAGEWFGVADIASRGSLTDFDVELAQESAIADPIVQVTQSGSYVRLRVLPLPFTDEAVVEADAVLVEPLPALPMVPGWAGMAALDRIRSSVERTVLPIRIRSGRPATCDWTGRDGRRVSLRISATWTPAASDDAAAMLWSPLVTATLTDFRFVPQDLVPSHAEVSEDQPRFGAVREGTPFVDVDSVLASQRTELVAAGGTGLQIFRGPAARAVRDGVTARLQASTRAAAVSLTVWDVPRGTELPADGSAPAGARELFRSGAPSLLGHSAVFFAGEGMTYLQDWDVEVAIASRIADPIVGVAMTGSFANLTVHPGPGGDATSGDVDLDLTFVRLDGLTSQVVVVPAFAGAGMAASDRPAPDATSPGNSAAAGAAAGTVVLPPTSYTIEKPAVRRSNVHTRLALSTTGVGVTRRTLPSLLGAGRELVVVVRAE